MTPHFVDTPTDPQWIDLDHVLAISQLQASTTDPNGYAFRRQFNVTLAFRNEPLAFVLADGCKFLGMEDNYKANYVFSKASQQEIDQFERAYQVFLDAWKSRCKTKT